MPIGGFTVVPHPYNKKAIVQGGVKFKQSLLSFCDYTGKISACNIKTAGNDANFVILCMLCDLLYSAQTSRPVMVAAQHLRCPLLEMG